MRNKLSLKTYQKDNAEKLDSATRSVNLEKKHIEFLNDNRVNLSAYVRDCIDALMNEAPKKSAK